MADLTKFNSEVSDASILFQAVKNTKQAIELFREAASNSMDADAASISITLEHLGGTEWDVEILDDGNGMDLAGLRAFFNAGQTVKDHEKTLVIGEKGLGSKTTFIAESIHIESRRVNPHTATLIGEMTQPLQALQAGSTPEYTVNSQPDHGDITLLDHGTRLKLNRVRIPSFNGKDPDSAEEVASRLMHYLRTQCATGTVKNRHAHKAHIKHSVLNVGAIPDVHLSVSRGGKIVHLQCVGVFDLPDTNVAPKSGPEEEGVERRSSHYCDVFDFGRSRTFDGPAGSRTVHYDGTAIIAGHAVRKEMLMNELSRGRSHKSQMGLHLAKDFIPLGVDSALSRDLIDSEYFYEAKIVLNSQAFELSTDRSSITNQYADDVQWILEDFKENISPEVESRAKPLRDMVKSEQAAIDAKKKFDSASRLKNEYASLPALVPTGDHDLQFAKMPRKEADTSHLLAMMVQLGKWADQLSPIAKFGRYIDDSTDILVENTAGEPLLVEVEQSLPNLFRHAHPMGSYDLVVVWDLGGMASGDARQAPWGDNGSTSVVTLKEADTGWILKVGSKQLRVIVLRDLVI